MPRVDASVNGKKRTTLERARRARIGHARYGPPVKGPHPALARIVRVYADDPAARRGGRVAPHPARCVSCESWADAESHLLEHQHE